MIKISTDTSDLSSEYKRTHQYYNNKTPAHVIKLCTVLCEIQWSEVRQWYMIQKIIRMAHYSLYSIKPPNAKVLRTHFSSITRPIGKTSNGRTQNCPFTNLRKNNVKSLILVYFSKTRSNATRFRWTVWAVNCHNCVIAIYKLSGYYRNLFTTITCTIIVQ